MYQSSKVNSNDTNNLIKMYHLKVSQKYTLTRQAIVVFTTRTTRKC